MKLNKFFGWMIIASVIVAFVACSDDDPAPRPPGENTIRVPALVTSIGTVETKDSILNSDSVKVPFILVDTIETKFVYSEVPKLKAFEIIKNKDQLIKRTTLNFNADGQLVGLSIVGENEPSTISYVYSGNSITKKDGEKVLAEMTLDDKSRLTQYKKYDQDDMDVVETTVFTYYEGLDYIKEITVKSGGAEEKGEYSYEPINAIFKYMEAPQWFILSELALTKNVDIPLIEGADLPMGKDQVNVYGQTVYSYRMYNATVQKNGQEYIYNETALYTGMTQDFPTSISVSTESYIKKDKVEESEKLKKQYSMSIEYYDD